MKPLAATITACFVVIASMATAALTRDLAQERAVFQPPVPAQEPAAGTPTTFEVASVKPNKSGDMRVMISLPPSGRYTATNVPLRLLIRQAYDLQDFQIVNGPNWMASDRFDIVAKAPEGTVGPAQTRPMMRALLADRFKLVAHTETREMPIYHLVLARTDGKLGPSLKESKTDCEALFRSRRGGPPPAMPQPGQPIECGFIMGMGTMNVGGMPILELARTLSNQLNRVVLDKTGLTGRYDFQLTFAPEGRGFGPLGPVPGAPEPPASDGSTPTLVTAIQEQLGLKLDAQRGPVEVLVIDRVDQPTED
jgi:uncharacterized protein (TIGR03435 family)